MGFLAFLVCLWVLDYLYFKIRYTKPNGPPVWYFFPFLGVTPFYALPRVMFKPMWNWYLENFPDVIICRFFIYPVVFAKNDAVRDVQNSVYCQSRSANGFERTLGYIMTGKPFWFVFDHNAPDCDWKSARKLNLLALNVLPKERKFQRIADVTDRFLKVIEAQKGRLWHYEDDLYFAKIQETCNVNLGDTFDDNNIQSFVIFFRHLANKLPLLMMIGLLPIEFLKMTEKLLPKPMRVTVIERIYEKLCRGVIDRRKGKTGDEPKDFVEAVLSVKEPEVASRFIRETGLFNMLASTHTTQHVTMATLAFISLHKRVQRKIHEELDRVVGSFCLTHDHLADLHYLKAAIHEGSRMSPPIPMICRWTTGPARVGHRMLEKDMRIAMFFVSETVNPEKFPNPDDFIPERFINGNDVFESSKDFNIFSRGRRMCSGTEIAGLSSLVYCAKILQHFEVSPESPDVVVPGYGGSTLTDFPAVPLKFKRRETAPEIETVPFDCSLTTFFRGIVTKEMALEAD